MKSFVHAAIRFDLLSWFVTLEVATDGRADLVDHALTFRVVPKRANEVELRNYGSWKEMLLLFDVVLPDIRFDAVDLCLRYGE